MLTKEVNPLHTKLQFINAAITAAMRVRLVTGELTFRNALDVIFWNATSDDPCQAITDVLTCGVDPVRFAAMVVQTRQMYVTTPG